MWFFIFYRARFVFLQTSVSSKLFIFFYRKDGAKLIVSSLLYPDFSVSIPLFRENTALITLVTEDTIDRNPTSHTRQLLERKIEQNFIRDNHLNALISRKRSALQAFQDSMVFGEEVH